MLLTALLPATHLAADLHSKLRLLINRARKPAGLMLPPAAPAGAACAGMGGVLFPAVAAHAGPPCLEGVELQHFVQQVVLPLLPSLQQHLVMALNVIKQPPQGDLDVLFNGKQPEAVARTLGTETGASTEFQHAGILQITVCWCVTNMGLLSTPRASSSMTLLHSVCPPA